MAFWDLGAVKSVLVQRLRDSAKLLYGSEELLRYGLNTPEETAELQETLRIARHFWEQNLSEVAATEAELERMYAVPTVMLRGPKGKLKRVRRGLQNF